MTFPCTTPMWVHSIAAIVHLALLCVLSVNIHTSGTKLSEYEEHGAGTGTMQTAPDWTVARWQTYLDPLDQSAIKAEYVSDQTLFILLLVFTVLTCISHIVQLVQECRRVTRNNGRGQQPVHKTLNWVRWIEYSITAPIMTIVVSFVCRLEFIDNILYQALLTFIYIICGMLSEFNAICDTDQHTSSIQKTRASSKLFAFMPVLFVVSTGSIIRFHVANSKTVNASSALWLFIGLYIGLFAAVCIATIELIFTYTRTTPQRFLGNTLPCAAAFFCSGMTCIIAVHELTCPVENEVSVMKANIIICSIVSAFWFCRREIGCDGHTPSGRNQQTHWPLAMAFIFFATCWGILLSRLTLVSDANIESPDLEAIIYATTCSMFLLYLVFPVIHMIDINKKKDNTCSKRIEIAYSLASVFSKSTLTLILLIGIDSVRGTVG